MAIALQHSGRAFDAWGGTTTIAASVSSITAGNLLVAYLSWEGGNATVSSVSDGTSNFTAGTKYNHSNNDQYQQSFYLLSANSGNKTITATMTSGKYIRTFHVLEFNLQSGEFIATAETGSYGTGSPFSSGNFTASGDDVICISHAKSYTSGSWSAHDIGGTTGVGYITVSDIYEGETWYRNSAISADNAQVAFSGGNDYVCSVVAFKAASGASGNPWYYYAQMAQKIKDKWRNLIRIPGFDEIMAFQRSLKGVR